MRSPPLWLHAVRGKQNDDKKAQTDQQAEAIGLDGNRFRLLIGLGFLVIVLFSPDGIVGLWERWRRRGEAGQLQPGGDRHG